MANKRPKPEEIVSKLRQVEVFMGQGMSRLDAIRQIGGCCQTKEPKHQYSFDEYFYEVTYERHSVRAASRLSLNVLRFESDLCELNRL